MLGPPAPGLAGPRPCPPTPLSRVWACSPRRTPGRGRCARPAGRGTVTELGESVCPYCGVGCRLRFEGTPEQITRVRGVEQAPANLGRLCAKGAQLGPTVHTADRLTR